MSQDVTWSIDNNPPVKFPSGDVKFTFSPNSTHLITNSGASGFKYIIHIGGNLGWGIGSFGSLPWGD